MLLWLNSCNRHMMLGNPLLNIYSSVCQQNGSNVLVSPTIATLVVHCIHQAICLPHPKPLFTAPSSLLKLSQPVDSHLSSTALIFFHALCVCMWEGGVGGLETFPKLISMGQSPKPVSLAGKCLLTAYLANLRYKQV